jgi:predicted P-loop ATPase
VFAGSVNPDTYLRDETGNRRFWPVRCGTIDLDALRRDRDQLWAEAVVRYREGAVWWLQDPALIAMAEEAQEMRLQSDAWDGLIEHWLAFERRRVNRGYVGYDDWQDEEVERATPLADVSVGEILEQAIGVEPGRWTKSDQMRVGASLKAAKWERYQRRGDGIREWRYRRS